MTMRLIDGVYITDTARVLGELTLGEDVNLWYGVVIRGDVAPISIGKRTNVQDNVVIHADHDCPLAIGADVSIGHGAVVHGVEVGAGSLIAMNATVLGGTRIGERCLIGAGALLPPGMEVPDESLVVGVPGRILRPINDQERAYLGYIPSAYLELAQQHVDSPDDARIRPWGASPPDPPSSE